MGAIESPRVAVVAEVDLRRVLLGVAGSGYAHTFPACIVSAPVRVLRKRRRSAHKLLRIAVRTRRLARRITPSRRNLLGLRRWVDTPGHKGLMPPRPTIRVSFGPARATVAVSHNGAVGEQNRVPA